MDKYDGLKRLLNGALGVGILFASIIFSREGFGFKDGDLWWVGLVLALAATGAQFMLTSKFSDLNLGIVVLGITSYVYSIYTNIIGIENLQEVKNHWLAVGAGVFLDIYPEMAIAWALKASREGDLGGNLVKLFQNWESLLPKGGHPEMQVKAQQTHQVTDRLPKREGVRPTASRIDDRPFQRTMLHRAPGGQKPREGGENKMSKHSTI